MRVGLSKNWVKGISIHLIRKNCCLSSCLLLTCKKNHVYLTDSQYYTWLLKNKCHLQHLSHSGYLIDYSKMSDFFFWLIFRVSSPPSLTTMRFSHSSSIYASLGESSKFPISSLSISSSSSLVQQLFLKGYLLQRNHDLFSKLS